MSQALRRKNGVLSDFQQICWVDSLLKNIARLMR